MQTWDLQPLIYPQTLIKMIIGHDYSEIMTWLQQVSGEVDLKQNKVLFWFFQDVLSAVIMVKLLSSCPLPESCSRTFWLLAPQIISALTVRHTPATPVCVREGERRHLLGLGAAGTDLRYVTFLM